MNQVTQPISCSWLLLTNSTPRICASFHLVLIVPPDRSRHQGVVRPSLGGRGGQGRGVGRQEDRALAHLRGTRLEVWSPLEKASLCLNTLKKTIFCLFFTSLKVRVYQPRDFNALSNFYLRSTDYIGILIYWHWIYWPYLSILRSKN